MEKIKRALTKNELYLFLIGEGGYYSRGLADFNEPTDYVYVWENEIIPMQNEDSIDLAAALKEAFLRLLRYEKDMNLALYSIVSHLNWYYYFSQKGSITFEMKLDDVALLLKEKIKERKVSLMEDKRWAGAEYNSKNGLWEVFMNVSDYFKRKYKGIAFMPSDDEANNKDIG